MPPALHDFLVSLTYPPRFSLWLLIMAGVVMLFLRWRGIGLVLAALAFAWSALWSVPTFSDALRWTLEQRYPVVEETKLPQVDAIVVLGGGGSEWWMDRENVTAEELESSRVAAGARAWLAGRAPVVILSGDGEGKGSEAARMADAITRLGVPRSALILEKRSDDTRENARQTAALAERRGIERILLVTSQVHMPRAHLLFREAGVDAVPLAVPERADRDEWHDRWLPSRSALWRSGRAVKEYAGLVAARLRLLFRDGVTVPGKQQS